MISKHDTATQPTAHATTLDYAEIQRLVARGRNLRAKAMRETVKSFFSSLTWRFERPKPIESQSAELGPRELSHGV
jgi:hypothetical protein